MSLRDQILAASDIERRVVTVPEWGDAKVEVRSPTGADRAAVVSIINTADPDPTLLYPALLIPSLYAPETGERLFSDDDAEALNAKNGIVLERLATVALELVAVTPEALEAGKGDS